jgi:hypothetical protein
VSGASLGGYLVRLPVGEGASHRQCDEGSRSISRDIGALLDKEREQAEASGYERGRDEMIVRLTEAERAAQVAIAAAYDECRASLGADVRRLVDAGLVSLRGELADAVAEIIEPFLSAKSLAQAIAAFNEGIRELLNEAGAIRLVVRGPERATNLAVESLSECDVSINVVHSDQASIVGCVDKSLVRTRLNLFEQSLKAIEHG